MNTRLKRFIGLALVFIILIIASILKINISSSSFPLIFFICFIIFLFVFEEKAIEFIIAFILSLIFFGLIILVSSWLFQFQVPYIKIPITDASITAIFTIVLTIATIVNVFIYSRSTKSDRLSTITVDINDNLQTVLNNIGPYPARSIVTEMEIFDYEKIGFFYTLVRNFKDKTSRVPDERIFLLPPNEAKIVDFTKNIKERFNLEDNISNYNGEFLGYITKEKDKKVEFKLKVMVKYSSDLLEEMPLPIIKSVRVKIDNNGMSIIRK